MRHKLITYLTLSIIILTSCDPGMKVDQKVFNDSNAILTITYKKFNKDHHDTIVQNMQPGQIITLDEWNSLGNKKTYNCCEYTRVVSVTSASGPIKKDFLKCEAWDIPNKKKLRKYNNETVKCELHIVQADI